MHIIIAIIGSATELFWALITLQPQRLALCFDALSPSSPRQELWQPRRAAAKPLHKLRRPVEAAALLMLAVAKAGGTQSQALLGMFSDTFKLSEKDAMALLVASKFLLRDENTALLQHDMENILRLSRSRFTPAQVESTLQLMAQVATLGQRSPTLTQQALIAAAERQLR